MNPTAATPNPTAQDSLAALLDAALPQTQCTRCGYPDCARYAQAMARGEAAINQCPPGGAEGVARLAAITGLPVLPLSAEHGTEGIRTVAFIDEAWCIGCTLCIKACPTDAIVGSNKRMHTVIEPYCTGCELCVPVCPVDCILLENVSGSATGWAAWPASLARLARQRYQDHQARLPAERTQQAAPADDLDDSPLERPARQAAQPSGAPMGAAAVSGPSAHAVTEPVAARPSAPSAAAPADAASALPEPPPTLDGAAARKAAIAAAMERARQRRSPGSAG